MAANSYLTRTVGSDGNRKTMTYSFWIRRAVVGVAASAVVICDEQQSYPTHKIGFESDDQLTIRSAVGTNNSAADQIFARTKRHFNDTTAWYHIVVAIDTTQADDANKVKLWVNGVQNISWVDDGPDCNQNLDTQFNRGEAIFIGNLNGAYSDMNLAHYHFVDGTALAPTVFGEFDSTSGLWKAKLNPSNITYGDNGYWLKFENASALGTDSSGEGNNFTVAGNLRQSISTPSNKFARLNPRGTVNGYATGVYQQHAGKTFWGTTGVTRCAMVDMCFAGGKWYWEAKIEKNDAQSSLGVFLTDSTSAKRIWQHAGDLSAQSAANGGNGAISFRALSSSQIQKANSNTSYGTGISDNDIIMFAFDADTGKIWAGRNGTWFNAPGTSNVGVPNTGANDSGKTLTNTDRELMSFYVAGQSSSGNRLVYTNFGDGYFGVTAVASANADSAGLGAFEYAVPSGFYSLCSKNIQNHGG